MTAKSTTKTSTTKTNKTVTNEKKLTTRLHFVVTDNCDQFFQAIYDITRAVIVDNRCILYGSLDVAGETPVLTRVEYVPASGNTRDKYYRVTLSKTGKICRKCELLVNRQASGDSLDQIADLFTHLLETAPEAQAVQAAPAAETASLTADQDVSLAA